ncbi:SCO1664 family protein [Chloroflexota bacterium]
MSESTKHSGLQSEPLTFAQILKVLTQGTIQEEHGILPWGSNYAYLVSVSDDERVLLAVYKPQHGERPLWDFPDGTLCNREVAAFLLSELLGWQLVPPTVLRDGPYGLGSVQFFVDHDPEITFFTPFPPECQAQLQQFAVFDYLINNADRKGGHCILDELGHLWGIDHGLSFHHQPKLRTVIWDYAGQTIPEKIVQDLLGLCVILQDEAASGGQALQQLLSDHELAALHNRLDSLIETRQFAQPGPGPNYPWPPV